MTKFLLARSLFFDQPCMSHECRHPQGKGGGKPCRCEEALQMRSTSYRRHLEVADISGGCRHHIWWEASLCAPSIATSIMRNMMVYWRSPKCTHQHPAIFRADQMGRYLHCQWTRAPLISMRPRAMHTGMAGHRTGNASQENPAGDQPQHGSVCHWACPPNLCRVDYPTSARGVILLCDHCRGKPRYVHGARIVPGKDNEEEDGKLSNPSWRKTATDWACAPNFPP